MAELYKKVIVIVKRENRDFLLKIRTCEFDVLMRIGSIKVVYEKSMLPERLNIQMTEDILIQIRMSLY